MEIPPDLLSMISGRSIIGHDHIQLASVHAEIAENPESRLHELLVPPFQASKDSIFSHLDAEIIVRQDVAHEVSPSQPPLKIGGAPLELETDVVFHVPLPDEGLHGGEVEAKAGGKAAEVSGDHEVVTVGVLGA